MNVLSIDPGPHVGIARYGVDASPEFAAWAWTPTEFHSAVEEGLLTWPSIVVIEGFNIGGQRGKASNETIEMIGVVKYALRGQPHVRLVEQQPSAAKFASDTKLRALGWWTTGPGDHARSATRHLITWLAENYPPFRDRLVACMAEAEGGARASS